MENPDKQAILKRLNKHYAQTQAVRLCDLFTQDAQRFDRYSLEVNDLFLDYSKNKFNEGTLELLIELLQLSDFADWRERLFSGDAINVSENQAVLHTILRRPYQLSTRSNGKDLAAKILATRQQMRTVCRELSGVSPHSVCGATITDVVSLGIGGSHLAPAMACRALKSYKRTPSRMHFVSTAGCGELESLLAELDPAHTCFIVVSKKFKTKETLMNARYARAWLGDNAQHQMIAVTANHAEAAEFGIAAEYCLAIPQTIGGRYSLCSAAGLPLAVDLGIEVFEELLAGAYQMDCHFQTAAPKDNMPVILALLSVWYNNFYRAHSHAILCYDTRLELFANYFQQVEMESNGKQVDRYGRQVDGDTAPVIWGGNALNGQHAYYQLLHQGSQMIPTDFIVTADIGSTDYKIASNTWPQANCFAQSLALMQGMQDAAPERIHPGDRPSNTIMLRKLTAHTLGSLIALYEHKVFCEGLIWGINSFDQWGVERGKQLADRFFDYLKNNKCEDESDMLATLDSSTRGLIDKYMVWRRQGD
ncbi:MAG: glucose-6-phosphate isomerase [Chromatiales bacterium]|nr:glucose-6-phosphate isomerase [Chromatiales bacterium]